jgi:hypothetical protein
MPILRFPPSLVNPDPGNPRDGWPDWVDSDRWSPTPGPDFLPSIDDERESIELLNGDDDEPTDAELDLMAMSAAWMSAVESGPVM